MKTKLILIFMVLSIKVSAQIIKEDFDGSSKLDWQEYAEKKASAIIQNGYFELRSLKKNHTASTTVNLPVNTEEDFTVRCEVIVPKLKRDNIFSIIFGVDENSKTTLIKFSETYANAYLLDVNNDNKIVSGKGELRRIKLPVGKNKENIIKIEFKYSNYKSIVTVNNMTAYETSRPMTTALFGFLTDNFLKIKSFEVEQE